MKKNDINDIIKLYNEYGLTIIGKYVNVDNNLDCIDNEGYKYSITPYNLNKRKNKNMSSGRFNNKNKFKEYNINHYIEINNISTSIINIPDNIDTEYIEFKCGKCNKNFKQLWKVFLKSKTHYCYKCASKEKNNKIYSLDKIKNIFENNGYIFLDDNNISYGTHYSYYIQDKEGYKGRMMPYSALKKSSKIEKFTSKNIYSINNINLFCKTHNINVECLDSSFSTYKKLKFQCKCGRIFYCTWDNVKNGKHQCNQCSKSISNNENTIIEFLISNNIEFKSQYNIGKFGNYKNLYFDFYLPKYNLFIEVDGEQHYKPVNFGGISFEEAKRNYIAQKQRDLCKNLYCQTHHINLIRISYNDIKNNKYINIISSKIDELRKYIA